MTVAQLIERLQKFPGEAVVRMALNPPENDRVVNLSHAAWDTGYEDGESTPDDPEPEPVAEREPGVVLHMEW